MNWPFVNKIISKLIKKEFKLQEIAAVKSQTSAFKKIFPCITVSRETGSGGRLIAKLAAKKLKMEFYNKQVVELIAKNAKKRKRVIEALDEKSKTFVEDIIDTLAKPQDKLAESRYFIYLGRTILSLVQKKPAVILGRGANFIIPSEKCLAIRIIAPFKTRVENTVKYEKKALIEAKEYIRTVHQARKDFVRKYFNKNISNANYYDLVINTKFLNLNQAVAIITKAFKEKFS